MLSNKEIKWITSLKNKKYRHMHRAFIAEGAKLVNDLLINGLTPLKILNAVPFDPSISLEPTIHQPVEPFVLKKLSNLSNPQGVLAVFEIPDDDVNIAHKTGEWSVVLDFIQDPGNFGTIIRTMDYLGVRTIYCSSDSVDLYNPKVVQATMGSLGRVKVDYVDIIHFLEQQDQPVYLADMEGVDYRSGDFEPGFIVFGNEGNGIRESIKSSFQKCLSIPRRGKGESLNIAIATSIIMAHMIR